jgi:biopolymer transport protein ExbB
MLMTWMPDFIVEGGWVMYPLMATSVLGLAVCLERAWVLRRGAVLPSLLVERAGATRGRGDVGPLAEALSRAPHAPLAVVLGAMLENLENPREQGEEAMLAAGRRSAASLERNLAWIEIVATVAPLLGLLGTVLGLVDIFSVISVEGVGDARVLSSGIKKALYTTVAGLCIGIPALAVFTYYSRRAERLAAEMEHIAYAVLGRLFPAGPVLRRTDRAEASGASPVEGHST